MHVKSAICVSIKRVRGSISLRLGDKLRNGDRGGVSYNRQACLVISERWLGGWLTGLTLMYEVMGLRTTKGM